ncbi:B-cell lymphoma/leukemia 11A [Liparis tanakae]|uniref:B-cell lymphoma/leukemia 11A n=1 Tax=Liparis tanakae TaxID=230148 RepID=A0A4Z2IR67_9TELE|nr:B-cell lymphoma/leukemia 11A [Liparis tanakae]
MGEEDYTHWLSKDKHVTEMANGTACSGERPPPAPQVQAPGEGRDLLTCGQCSRAFPLAHILAFIQHKQGGCRSRNQGPGAHATPPSPANQAQHSIAAAAGELGPAFIELRRGGTALGAEPRLRVKAEHGKAGERSTMETNK